MSDLAELYQSVIVEHDRQPRNFRKLDHASHHGDGRNPFCGDEVQVELAVDGTGVITDAAFQGVGCAVSRASASMMTAALLGRTLPEAAALFEAFHRMLTGAAVDRGALGKLAVFQGIAAYPMRVKCATLAWHAMKKAMQVASRES